MQFSANSGSCVTKPLLCCQFGHLNDISTFLSCVIFMRSLCAADIMSRGAVKI